MLFRDTHFLRLSLLRMSLLHHATAVVPGLPRINSCSVVRLACTLFQLRPHQLMRLFVRWCMPPTFVLLRAALDLRRAVVRLRFAAFVLSELRCRTGPAVNSTPSSKSSSFLGVNILMAPKRVMVDTPITAYQSSGLHWFLFSPSCSGRYGLRELVIPGAVCEST